MRSVVHPRGPASVTANLTPMIDMTFLLIVFFVLVSQITDRQRVRMDLPRPRDPATMRQRDEQRTVINVVPAEDGEVAAIRVGGSDFPADPDGFAALRLELERQYRETPAMRMNLRADRRVRYRSIEPVMRSVTAAAQAAGVVPRVNLVVERKD